MKGELQVHLDGGGHLYLDSVERGATTHPWPEQEDGENQKKMTPGWSDMPLVIKLKMAFLPSSDVDSIKVSNILCLLTVYLCASFNLDW